MTVVATYDVANDSRRSRLAATLQACGDRIQLSVFVLTIDEVDLADLLARVRTLLDPTDDSFYVFRQCSACWEQLVCVGQAHPPSKQLCWTAL